MIQRCFSAYTARSSNSQEGVRPCCCAAPKTTPVGSYSTFLAHQTNHISFLEPTYSALTGTFSSALNLVWKSLPSKHPDLNHQQLCSFTFIAEKAGSPERRALYLPVLSPFMQPLLTVLYLQAPLGNDYSWQGLLNCGSMCNSHERRSFPISGWSWHPPWQAELQGLLVVTLSGWFFTVTPPLAANGQPSWPCLSHPQPQQATAPSWHPHRFLLGKVNCFPLGFPTTLCAAICSGTILLLSKLFPFSLLSYQIVTWRLNHHPLNLLCSPRQEDLVKYDFWLDSKQGLSYYPFFTGLCLCRASNETVSRSMSPQDGGMSQLHIVPPLQNPPSPVTGHPACGTGERAELCFSNTRVKSQLWGWEKASMSLLEEKEGGKRVGEGRWRVGSWDILQERGWRLPLAPPRSLPASPFSQHGHITAPGRLLLSMLSDSI